MFRERTAQYQDPIQLNKRIARLKTLARKYKRAEVIQNALIDISNAAASVSTPLDFYLSVHKAIQPLLPTDNLYIATLNTETNELSVPFFIDEKDPHPTKLYPEEGVSDALQSGLTGLVLKTGKILHCDNHTYDELIKAGDIVSRGSDCHQWLGAPIKNNGLTYGVIAIQSYHTDVQYGEMEIELMNFISHHISGVVSRLQHQQQLEQAIKQRTKELNAINEKLKLEILEKQKAEQLQKTLFEIANLASCTIDTDHFYKKLHQIIGQLLPANNCFIALLDESGEILEFPFYVSEKKRAIPQPRKLTDGLTEYLLQHKQPKLFSKDEIQQLISTNTIYNTYSDLCCLDTLHQWVGTPLFIQGKIAGVLAVYSFNVYQSFQVKDLDLLTFVSQHIATAIEKKRSAEALKLNYEQLEEKVHQRTLALAEVNASLEAEITKRKQAESLLMHDAKHDALTGLPNRAMFMERLSQAVKHSRRHCLDRFAVLFIDMDRFKLLNDTLGHLAGDQFLIETAKRLTTCIRENDSLARLGGDEFIILLDNITTQQGVVDVAERIMTEVLRAYQLSGQEFYSSASIGIAISDNTNADTAESILKHADAAMYQAKAKGKGCFVFHDNNATQADPSNIEITDELTQALKRKEIQVKYLPVMDLKDNNIIALEPQLFWRHPTRGKIKKEQLINIAEHSNMRINLDKYLLTQINLDYPQLQEHFYKDIALQISLSSQHLKQKHAMRSLKNTLKQCYFDLNNITLFFNEKAFIQDTESHITAFDELIKLDIKLGIDAYGSAHSAISCLVFLPITELKLDATYCGHLESEKYRKLINAYFLAAQALDLSVFATGIKTQKQKHKLIEIGFSIGQGAALGERLILQQSDQAFCA